MSEETASNHEKEQTAKARKNARAANIGDIEQGEKSQLSIQSETKRHSQPKPHNQQGTNQFNGLAFLFQLLSNVVPPRFFDAIFGTSTIGGLLAFGYWVVTELYGQFPSESFSIPNYVIPAFVVALIGIIYLSVRADSQCPNCDTPFALRRSEREVERDKLSGEADDLLIKREEQCTQCSYESEKTFWKKDPNQRSQA